MLVRLVNVVSNFFYLRKFTNVTILPLYIHLGLVELDLQCLQVLKNLTLSADIMPYGGAGRETLSRFMWLCTTLRTCAEPSSVENITIIIRTRNYDLVKSLAWNYFDDVFKESAKWPKLSNLSIQINNENTVDVRRYKEGSIEKMIYPAMPALMRAGVLKIRFSEEVFEFWSL